MSLKNHLAKIPIIKRLYPSLFCYLCKIFHKKIFIKKFKGQLFELDINEPIDKSIILFDQYENKQIEFTLGIIKNNKINIYLDIGANSGIYSLLISSKFKKLKIFSFEPIKKTYDKLLKNIRLNKSLKNIKTYNYGASNKNSRQIMKALIKKNIIQYGGFGISQTKKINKNFYTEEASFKKLANVFNFRNKKVFIKIDTEGHENLLLDGIRKLIKNNEIHMQIEIWPKNYLNVIKKLTDLKLKEINKIDSDFYFTNK